MTSGDIPAIWAAVFQFPAVASQNIHTGRKILDIFSSIFAPIIFFCPNMFDPIGCKIGYDVGFGKRAKTYFCLDLHMGYDA
ncbi:unnamed protein product [Coffea canephora]|uniref:Uncharacterized protein n=1 Tax=Coffea canephora TaxID=49390 RepID=A0A068TTP8_COFCA|nr:unnamed protein product [Coffea canephora]